MNDHLARLLGPAEEEASCDECFALLDRYVDIEVATGDAAARMPALAAHLRGCPACAEDHASLRDYVVSTSRSASGSGADRPAE